MKNARRDAISVITAFRGLAPYGESDREMFFGREAERGELAKLIAGERFRVGLLLGEAGDFTDPARARFDAGARIDHLVFPSDEEIPVLPRTGTAPQQVQPEILEEIRDDDASVEAA